MSTSSQDFLRVTCASCHVSFRVPARKAGKRGPCPKCAQPVIVPIPAPAPAAEPAGDVDWSHIADAADEAEASEPAEYAQPEAFAPAPRARSIGPSAKLLAGLTPAQRAALARRAEAGAASRFKKGRDGDDNVWGFPSFLMGLALAAGGALIGAALWFGLLAGTGRELRFMAVAVGVLAGGGMAIGYQKHDMGAGFLAACMAVGAIVLAKFCVIWFGAPYLLQAKARIEISEAEQRIDEEFSRPVSFGEARGSAFTWLLQDYVLENDLTVRGIYGAIDHVRDAHLFPIYDKRDAAVGDELLDMHYRYTLYVRQVEQRHRKLLADWDRENPPPEAAEGEGGGEEADEDPAAAFREAYARGQERQAALQEAFRQAEKELFLEAKAMEASVAKEKFDAWRERQRRQAKLAARRSGELIQEVLGHPSDPQVAQTQQTVASYMVFRMQDLFLLPMALLAAWKIGSGFGDD